MEEEIDASPTSKKNYKKNTKYRIPQEVSTTVGKINRKLMKDDQNNGFGGQSTEDSNCLNRSQIWQSAYLLEEADKVRVAPRSCRAFNQIERRMSRPAGFLSVTQLCASQQSTTTAGNEVKESQWEVTESQFQKLDDVIKVSYDLEMRTRNTSDSVEMNGNIKDVSKDATQPVEKIEDVVANEHHQLTPSQRDKVMAAITQNKAELDAEDQMKKRVSILCQYACMQMATRKSSGKYKCSVCEKTSNLIEEQDLMIHAAVNHAHILVYDNDVIVPSQCVVCKGIFKQIRHHLRPSKQQDCTSCGKLLQRFYAKRRIGLQAL